MKKKKKKICPKCGERLKKIAYGLPRDVNNNDYHYMGCIPFNSKLKYYCESCDSLFSENDIQKNKKV